MPIQLISNPADRRLSHYADLRSQNSTADRDASTFIVEGRLCVQKLAESDFKTMSVVVQDGRHAEVETWFGEEVPIYALSATDIRELVGFDFHRGVLACGQRPSRMKIDSLAFDATETPLALGVFGVSLHENLGSMIRTATALGIHHLITGPNTADPFSRRAIRVSMGTVFQHSVYEADDPAIQLRKIAANQNIRVVATTLSEDATPLEAFQRDERPIVLVVGSEPDGIGAEIESAATDRVTIPMKMGTDSLNVSVAAAIFMYELTK